MKYMIMMFRRPGRDPGDSNRSGSRDARVMLTLDGALRRRAEVVASHGAWPRARRDGPVPQRRPVATDGPFAEVRSRWPYGIVEASEERRLRLLPGWWRSSSTQWRSGQV